MPELDSDRSADTGRFQSFAQRRDEELPPPWQMRAPAPRIGQLAVIVVLVAIVAALCGLALVG